MGSQELAMDTFDHLRITEESVAVFLGLLATVGDSEWFHDFLTRNNLKASAVPNFTNQDGARSYQVKLSPPINTAQAQELTRLAYEGYRNEMAS